MIDSRTREFYTGDMPGNYPRQGHIAGARSLPFNAMYESSNTLKSEPVLRSLFEAAGATPGGDVVTYCHVGQQASAGYFAARVLGYRAHLYDGSFGEWSRTDLPVQKGSAPKDE